MARWRVDAGLWSQFVAAEARRGGSEPGNELPPLGDIPPAGFEVVVEENAVLVDGRRFELPRRGTPEVLKAGIRDPADAPTTLEITLKYPARGRRDGQMQSARYTRLTLPVPGPAWREARKAAAHFNGGRPGDPDFFHGRGDGNDPEDLSRCANCGHETYQFRSECERCGMGLQSRRWSRRFGFMLLLCGLILSALMGGVLFYTVPALLQPGELVGDVRFAGGPGMATLVLMLLVGLFVLGVAIVVYGIWQMATGKVSLRAARIAAYLLSALLFSATIIQWLD
ncbi:hypothetical protein [Arenimonas aestuarii]